MVKRAVKKNQTSHDADSKILSRGSSAYTSVIDLVSVTEVDTKSNIEGISTKIRNHSVTPIQGLKKRPIDSRKLNTSTIEEVKSESGILQEVASEKISSSKHTKHSSEYQKTHLKIN